MIITYEELSDVRRRHAGETIVFSSGTFDLLHAGHVLFLEEAKKRGDIFVLAVGNDVAGKKKGKGRPILNEHMRLKLLDALKPIDYVFIHRHPDPKGEYHNTFLEDIFPKLKPDIWVVNTDASEIAFRKELAKKYGIELNVFERTSPPEFEGISTTKIIEKIVRDFGE